MRRGFSVAATGNKVERAPPKAKGAAARVRDGQEDKPSMCDASHIFSKWHCDKENAWSSGCNNLSNAINRKPLGFDYFRRLKKSWRRGRAIEYALIALLIAFTAFQVLLAVGAKAI